MKLRIDAAASSDQADTQQGANVDVLATRVELEALGQKLIDFAKQTTGPNAMGLRIGAFNLHFVRVEQSLIQLAPASTLVTPNRPGGRG